MPKDPRPVTKDEVSNIETLARAATPGPRQWYRCGKEWLLWIARGCRPIILDAHEGTLRLRDQQRDLMIPFDPDHPDAKFIAALDTALVLRLCATIREQGEIIAEVRDWFNFQGIPHPPKIKRRLAALLKGV